MKPLDDITPEFEAKIAELRDRLQARGYPLELPAEREEEE